MVWSHPMYFLVTFSLVATLVMQIVVSIVMSTSIIDTERHRIQQGRDHNSNAELLLAELRCGPNATTELASPNKEIG